jgi:hypothetical protein
MRVEQLLHSLFKKTVSLHSKRLDSLMCAVSSGMSTKYVTVTGLGRRLNLDIKVKNR